jgi:hypothetical protein
MDMNYQKVWACALPDCSHYMPKHLEQMMATKNTICWDCGEEFLLSPMSLMMDKPICLDCRGLSAALRKIKEDELNKNVG